MVQVARLLYSQHFASQIQQQLACSAFHVCMTVAAYGSVARGTCIYRRLFWHTAIDASEVRQTPEGCGGKNFAAQQERSSGSLPPSCEVALWYALEEKRLRL